MKILQICSASSIGGGERHVSDLSNALAKRGHQVYVAVRPGSPMVSMLREIGPENLLEVEMRNAAGVISASRIARFAAETGADAIHAHLGRDYPIAAVASRLSGVPFVLTRHVLFPMKRLQKYVLSHVSAAIAPSTAVFNAFVGEGIVSSDKVNLIHNGVDVDHFAPGANLRQQVMTVGTIGEFGWLKGHDTFIRAAAIVATQMPDIRFIIAGDDLSHQRERRELKRLITELDMEDRIELAGWANDVRVLLGKMDLFVSASRSESFGLSIAEAMSSDIAVIATATEGARELIEQGVSGLLVPLDDPAALAASIMKLSEDSGLRGQIAAGGRERIKAAYSLDQMVRKTESVYSRVVAT